MADTSLNFTDLPPAADIARKSELLAEFKMESGNSSATADDMFDAVMERGHKAKDAKSGVVTNGSGAFSMTYPAGYWKAEPSVNAAPISATGGNGQLTVKVTKVLANNAWTVNVAFAMLPAQVTVLVAGTTTLWVNPGVVTFDYQAFEPTT